MVKILIFSILGGIIGNPVIAFILILAIVVVLFLHLKLSTFIFYAFISILLLFSFISDPEESSSRATQEPIIYPADSKNKEHNDRDKITYEHPIEQHIEDNINTVPSIQNLNQLLNNSEKLSPNDRQNIEQIREKRIKQFMDQNGQSIIDEYNRNNPTPIITRQNEQPESSSNQKIVNEEKKQATPNDKFISVLK